MKPKPWTQKWSGCPNLSCDGRKFFSQMHRRWSVNWQRSPLRQAACKHKYTHTKAIKLTFWPRWLSPLCLCMCACVCAYQSLTLTLRLSLTVDDLSGVWERRLLGTVGIPEDSKATALLLKTGKETSSTSSTHLHPKTFSSSVNILNLSSAKQLCNTLGNNLPEVLWLHKDFLVKYPLWKIL